MRAVRRLRRAADSHRLPRARRAFAIARRGPSNTGESFTMAKYEVEFDRDGKITIEDPEFIRRLTFVLHHDRRLLLSFAPRDPSEVDLTNPKCPPDILNLLCPPPDSPQKLCPDPMDTSCPMLFRRPLEVFVRNERHFEKEWKAMQD
jgi:hypothetical protein